MQPEAFVQVLSQVAKDGAVEDVVAQLERPSGRNPAQERRELSEWFIGLSDADRRNVEAVIVETARVAVFGVLCALDGSRAIVSADVPGCVELSFSGPNGRVLLTASDGSGSALHELL
jgi:hypothetical protein